MLVDIITALFLMAVSVGAYAASLEFPEGAQLFPQLLSYSIGILAVIVVVMAARKGRPLVTPRGKAGVASSKAYLTFGLSVLYVVGIQTIGFFVSSVLISVVLMMYFGIRKVSTYAAALTCMLLFYYLLFDRFLHVPLPHGLFY